MAREWKIIVGNKDKTLTEFSVPIYRLDGDALRSFLQAIVTRYQTQTAEDMVDFYLNNRKGNPRPSQNTKIINYFRHETRETGVWCGTWEMYAKATYEITQEQADTIEFYRQQNIKASKGN